MAEMAEMVETEPQEEMVASLKLLAKHAPTCIHFKGQNFYLRIMVALLVLGELGELAGRQA
jgi:hypothetical protein